MQCPEGTIDPQLLVLRPGRNDRGVVGLRKNSSFNCNGNTECAREELPGIDVGIFEVEGDDTESSFILSNVHIASAASGAVHFPSGASPYPFFTDTSLHWNPNTAITSTVGRNVAEKSASLSLYGSSRYLVDAHNDQDWLWTVTNDDLREQINFGTTAAIEPTYIPSTQSHASPASSLNTTLASNESRQRLDSSIHDSTFAAYGNACQVFHELANPITLPGAASAVDPTCPVTRRQSAPAVPVLDTIQGLPSISSSHEYHASSVGDHIRSRRHSDKFHGKPSIRSDPTVTIIQECGTGSILYSSSPVKGRRSGPLSVEQKHSAGQCRRLKRICIRCKKDKQPCIPSATGGICRRCLVLGLTAKWQQPCTKASFLDVIESGTCNYISQRAVNHLTLDGARRIRIDLPETLDLDQLLGKLSVSQTQFNVRVRQASGSLYILDLARCHRYLSAIRRHQPSSVQNLRDFIDREILKANHWDSCVGDCSPLENLMAYLSIWGNMPSRASYSYIPHRQPFLPADIPEKDMDVEDPDDHDAIIMASQLSRIVCRKLEVDAYSHLQKALNDWPSIQPEEMLSFVRELGLVLLTLRWRVSWWTLLGDGGKSPDDKGKEAFAYRVHSLCHILYFYYCMMRRKLPTWCSKKEFHGRWSMYPDTSLPVFEKFPEEESIEGLNAWMLDGRRQIIAANVEGKLAGIGLRSERVAGAWSL